MQHALALAAQHGAGLLAWAPDEAWAEAALVLEPETEADWRLGRFAAANALADALAPHAPAELPLGFHWPTSLHLNGAWLGEVLSQPGPAGLLVLGFRLRLTFPPGHQAGHAPGETALAEEGAEPCTAAELTAGWALHLMAGLDSWGARGWAQLAEHFLARLLLPPAAPGLRRGLDPTSGALLLDRDGLREVWEVRTRLEAGPSARMGAAASAAKPRPADAGRVTPEACLRDDAIEGQQQC